MRGGDADRVGTATVTTVSGPPPPLLTEAEETRRYGFGEGHPDAGPVSTVFRFKVFPRRSPSGAKPVLYKWWQDGCRQASITGSRPAIPQRFDCSSPRQSSPNYQLRFSEAGHYAVWVEITYDDGEMERLPIAKVSAGMREHVFRLSDGSSGHSALFVPSTETDYTPIRQEVNGAPTVVTPDASPP
jgi:hypothetical protein